MYLGNQPALNYTSLATQTFNAVTGQTQYSLDHSVANGNDILLYIANVKQVEGSGNSYTASGNTLTLNTAISAGTEMYCLYVSKAIQTVNPPNASVGTSQLVDGAVTPSKQSALANPFASQLLHVRDEKASGTNGGSASVGNNTLTLNTVLTNEITGASLSSNQITLPAGTYYIEASGMVFFVNNFKLFLRNVTDSTNTLIGSNGWATTNVASSNSNLSHVKGRFTIASQKTFSLLMYTSVARATNGLGVQVGDGTTEVYHQAQIWRTA
jgi:hypothetical protein